ncbi:MAG: hypothetical protein RBR22_08810 [Desulfuromonas sp.]|nr:hypothetical protein [Desulfuromonas sp.]
MKALTKLTTAVTLVALSAAPVFAAQQAQQSSGLLAWLFIGFCALIVIGQLVPAVITGIGMVKGVISGQAHHH